MSNLLMKFDKNSCNFYKNLSKVHRVLLQKMIFCFNQYFFFFLCVVEKKTFKIVNKFAWGKRYNISVHHISTKIMRTPHIQTRNKTKQKSKSENQTKTKSDHFTIIDLSPEAIEEEEEGIRKGTVFNTYRMWIRYTRMI